MGDKDDNSLAPVQRSASMHDELAQLNTGQGTRLAAGLAIATALIVGGMFWMGRMDDTHGYAEAGHALEQLRQGELRSFSLCAFPGVSESRLQSEMGRITAMEQLGDRLGKAYGKTLRSCLPKLAEFNRGLAKLTLPGELSGVLGSTRDAGGDLEQRWSDYADYLEAPGKEYSHAGALPLIERVASGREAYDEAHRALRDQLNEKLF